MAPEPSKTPIVIRNSYCRLPKTVDPNAVKLCRHTAERTRFAPSQRVVPRIIMPLLIFPIVPFFGLAEGGLVGSYESRNGMTNGTCCLDETSIGFIAHCEMSS